MKEVREWLLAGVLVALSAVPVQALDLNTVLGEVARANPSLQASRAMVGAAEERVGPAGAWPSPMVMMGVMNVPTTGALDQEPMTMKQVNVSQRVPVFGSKGLARRSARQGLAEEEASNEMAHYEAFGMAWRVYAGAYYAAERRRAAEAHLAIMNRMVESARARYESGVGRLEDVLRAQAEQARMLADIEMFRAEERSARARLDALRGRTAGAADDSLAPPPDVAVPADASGWVAAVNDGHPRLRELDARAKSRRLSAAAARRMAWPDLSLQFGYGFRETLSSGKSQDDMWSAMVGFEVPIFAGQSELRMADERDAMATAAEDQKHAERLKLIADVSATHADAAASARAVGLLADTVVVTQRRALEASWSAYTAGTTDLWRTLEAAHQLYMENLALTRAREALARAEAEFLALTGRGDLLGVPLPPVPGSNS